MTLHGDLSTLDLAGLLQNLETHQKDGVLRLETKAGEREIYFDKGQISLVTYQGRPDLVEVLVASRMITEQQLELAKKKRRGSGKSLCETLVGRRTIREDDLVAVAHARLLDEACEIVSAEGGAFTFTEGAIPRGVFDPEERRLRLRLPAGPLLLESARREDHWRLIRERVPSDTAHFVVQHVPRAPEDPAAAELQATLLDGLDGTRGVTEVMARFPHRRFEAYQLLAGLVEARAVREAAATDISKLASESVLVDKVRARALVDRGLEASPRNLELLKQKARMAEGAGEVDQAVEALKMVVHMHLEAGETGEAQAELDHLKDLAASDPSIWEKSFQLALDDGRYEDAVSEGKELSELYKGPGLFKKAKAVISQLVDLEPESWELVRELARLRAETGERKLAIQELESFGEARLAEAEYPLAARVFEEVLALDPRRKSATETLDLIQSGEHERHCARMRRLKRRVLLGLSILALAGWLGYEGTARRAYVQTVHEVWIDNLIEDGRYEEAAGRFDDLRARFPFATTGWYDARLRARDLRTEQAPRVVDEE